MVARPRRRTTNRTTHTTTGTPGCWWWCYYGNTTMAWMAAVGGIGMVHMVWSWNVFRSNIQSSSYYYYDANDSIDSNRTTVVMLNNATRQPTHTTTAVHVQPEMTPLATPTTNLRFDWTRLERHSSLARRMADHQSNCHIRLATFRYRNRFGLGSDLHVYSQALCNALESNTNSNTRTTTMPWRVRTALPWTWLDTQACWSGRNQTTNTTTTTTTTSAMTCYFPESELTCDSDRHLSPHQEQLLLNVTRGRGRLSQACPTVLAASGGVAAVRAATTEFLFTRVSPLVQREAERQWRHVLDTHASAIAEPSAAPPPSPPPPLASNLITVHIRWGDKGDEMTLIPIHKYVAAVHQLIQQRIEENPDWMTQGVHIFCATEDPQALQAFQEAAPRSWIIHVDWYYQEMLPHRHATYNGSPRMAHDLAGRPGLVALGSLLVSMEANSFVLTTSSNWSRLINELRRNVLDPNCHNCTRWIDLSPGTALQNGTAYVSTACLVGSTENAARVSVIPTDVRRSSHDGLLAHVPPDGPTTAREQHSLANDCVAPAVAIIHWSWLFRLEDDLV